MDTNVAPSPLNQSVGDIIVDIKDTILGLFDDLIQFEYHPAILFRDRRLFYLGILILIIALCLILCTKSTKNIIEDTECISLLHFPSILDDVKK